MLRPSLFPLIRSALKYPEHTRHQIIKKLKIAARQLWAKNNGPNRFVPDPLGYGIQLTSNCNLRCLMCYEWGPKGWYRMSSESKETQTRELDWFILESLIKRSHKRKPYFILWGGEPLLYTHFSKVINLLSELKCFSYVSTNGTLLDRYISEISRSKYITFLISVDGIGETNDAIRGKGIYEKVMGNIEKLKGLKHPPYLGVELTILRDNVGQLEEFCDTMCKKGLDWISLNLCWFISTAQKSHYEACMEKTYRISPRSHLAYHDPSFKLDRNLFMQQYDAIQSKKYPIPVVWMPPFRCAEQINTYIDDPEKPLTESFCYKQWIQMDIKEDASVVACKNWPDYIVGNLKIESPEYLWNCESYRRFRSNIYQTLMPICSKCYALGLYRRRFFF